MLKTTNSSMQVMIETLKEELSTSKTLEETLKATNSNMQASIRRLAAELLKSRTEEGALSAMISNLQATIQGQEAELSRNRKSEEDLEIPYMYQTIEKESVGLSRCKTEEGGISFKIPSIEVTIKRL